VVLPKYLCTAYRLISNRRICKLHIAIPEKHDKLITSLRTAYAKELDLDKNQTSYDDLLDALRLALKGNNIE
jgi:hypothetical protein